MKVAIVGSRTILVEDFEKFLPENTTEIVSGGASGVDSCAGLYAKKHGIKYTEFLPEYDKFGKVAPLYRNNEIVNYSDIVLAFWDGKSKGTKYVINYCEKQRKEIKLFKFRGADYGND